MTLWRNQHFPIPGGRRGAFITLFSVVLGAEQLMLNEDKRKAGLEDGTYSSAQLSLWPRQELIVVLCRPPFLYLHLSQQFCDCFPEILIFLGLHSPITWVSCSLHLLPASLMLFKKFMNPCKFPGHSYALHLHMEAPGYPSLLLIISYHLSKPSLFSALIERKNRMPSTSLSTSYFFPVF